MYFDNLILLVYEMSSTNRNRTKCSICGLYGHNRANKKFHPIVAEASQTTRVTQVNECPICFNPLENVNCCTTRCGHNFCLECFIKHTKKNNKCPMCRGPIPSFLEQPPIRNTDETNLQRNSRRNRENAAARPTIYHMEILNFTNTPFNIWWIPSDLRTPVPLHYNVSNHRTIRVASIGHIFAFLPMDITTDNIGSQTIGESLKVTFIGNNYQYMMDDTGIQVI